MGQRRSLYATLTAKLTLLSLVCGILGGACCWWADRKLAEQSITQNKIDLNDAKQAFKEAMTDSRATMDHMNTLLVTVMQSEAGLHSDMVNLNNRVDRIERRP